jgi:hypothetical protein
VRALVVASVVGAGCSDPAEASLPGFAVQPAVQWSGGTITVRSPYFVNRNPLPVLTASAETLAVSRVDDSTLAATLTPGPSGPVTIFVSRGSAMDSVANVQRVGFQTKYGMLMRLDGELLATDSAGVPIVLGGVVNGTQIRETVLRVRPSVLNYEAIVLRQPSNAFYGMAPSVTPGEFAVRDSTDSLRIANLLSTTPVVTGTVPWIGTAFSRQVSRLSPGIWLFTGSHQSWTRRESDSMEITRVQSESPYNVFMSPRGDRTTISTAVVQTPGGGVPVFDNATGTVAYSLPLLSIETATFSFDGATVFAAGGNQYRSDTLIALDAATGGELLPRVTLPDSMHAFSIVYRPAGGGQLLLAAANSRKLALLVYRANDLKLLGVLPSTFTSIDDCGQLPQTGPCFMGVVTFYEATHTAYVVAPGSPFWLWTFDLLSTP